MSAGPTIPPTILVCDDEASIRQLVAMKLRGAGYQVFDARNGHDGYCICDHGALPAGAQPRTPGPVVPDLIVTDLQMPMMNGLDMCVRLREFGPTSHVPALMLTARGYILDQSLVCKTNIRAFMCKPFAGQQLLDKVRDLLGKDTAQAA
jgi:DNA-binding response OmpR family regulator